MRILVIDDDHIVRSMVSKVLRAAGHDVATAPDGARAMILLPSQQPHIVITDILMPEQDGFETIIKIRHEYPDIKIVAMSSGFGRGELDVLSMAHALGADEVIAKPFEARELLDRLDKLDQHAEAALHHQRPGID